MTFHYKSDASGTPQFGLIAEEVAKENPDLVVRDKNGEIYTVRYDQPWNAMLLNEFLKEHKRIEKQEGKIARQEATIAELKSTIAQQQTGFQSRLAEQEKHKRGSGVRSSKGDRPSRDDQNGTQSGFHQSVNRP